MDNAGEILWRRGRQALFLQVQRREVYPMIFQRGCIPRLGELLKDFVNKLEAHSVIVVTDANLTDRFLGPVRESLDDWGIPAQAIVVPCGEISKSVKTALSLWDSLLQLEAERRTILLALGGGVLCDLVGFVAATYMRGLPYINVPTSLIAQIDGAIGGKVGVDHHRVKNLIGAFYHPAAVMIDLDALKTLPRRELSSGLAEALKVATISSEPLFEKLECIDLASDSSCPNLDLMSSIVEESIVAKIRLLAADPFERSLRRLLNFGHTVGHALEAATDFRRYRHGEAVAVGIAVATQVAMIRDVCSQSTGERILRQCWRSGLDVTMPGCLADSVWEEMEIIRRIRNGKLYLVVPSRIGEGIILDSITFEEFWCAVRALNARIEVENAIGSDVQSMRR